VQICVSFRLVLPKKEKESQGDSASETCWSELYLNQTMLGRRAATRLTSALKNVRRNASTPAVVGKDTKADKKALETPPATTQQSPNYATTWSTNQRPRPGPGSGPRFEQTAMEFQPNPLSAMELISREPIRLVQGRKAVCDGGMCFHGTHSCCASHVPSFFSFSLRVEAMF